MPRAKRETRAVEGRAAGQRRMPQTRGVGALHIPENIIKEAKSRGMVLRWIAETVEGAPRAVNVQNRLMNGWQPVPADRYPELVPPLLPGQQPEQIIRRGGQILVEMPKRDYDADRRELDKQNMDDLKSVSWADGPTDSRLQAPREDFGSRVDIERVVSQGPAFEE